MRPMLFLLLFSVFGNSYATGIKATHVYHNHMPNFWPYFDVASYDSLSTGMPISYTVAAQVIELKKSPPYRWPFLPNGLPMPHDNLAEGGYYSHHAKWGAYQYWPPGVVSSMAGQHPLAQSHVTMSGAVITAVHSLNTSFVPELQQHYNNPEWYNYWRQVHQDYKSPGGYPKLDLLNFTGHHVLGPLVGAEYFEKDLIFQRVVYKSAMFLGSAGQMSRGYFPTELGFSKRLIPTLTKLGISWAAVGNVHFSRTLKDYPYLNDPGVDTLTSPPNRADLRNESHGGVWKSKQMFNEKQVTHNKFPFAAQPRPVEYVDPATGEISRLSAIPVEQASSWEEGYQGRVEPSVLDGVGCEQTVTPCYFVIAHDGDNSSGRAGSEETWRNSGDVTYKAKNTEGMGVDEYLSRYPVAEKPAIHIQDGSWIDTRDSSADPTWYHWHLPFGVWEGQRYNYNQYYGEDLGAKVDWHNNTFQFQVSLEKGFHFLERNYALLQAALNYAKTAEEVFLRRNPKHWAPNASIDSEITFAGNQLNPHMYTFPIKGQAVLPELAWYFLLPAMDSGFGYYDENTDDHVKPTLSFNQSLYFSKRYLEGKKAQDLTGPSIWWPQRYPYNPGSVNKSKAEGWATLYANRKFALYTYVFDVNEVKTVNFKIRRRQEKRLELGEKGYDLYDPVDGNKWLTYSAKIRKLNADMNGVGWQNNQNRKVMDAVPAKEIGDLYYAYFDEFSDELIDYYVEASDMRGNLSRSDIQHAYVGTGFYKQDENGKWIEADAGRAGQSPFIN